MPLATQHAAPQTDKGFDEFRTVTDDLPDGISLIVGITEDGSEVSSVRADADKWTVEAFREWLEDHDFKTSIEEATGGEEEKATLTTGPPAGPADSHTHEVDIPERTSESIRRVEFCKGTFHAPEQPTDGDSIIVYGVVWCPHKKDQQGDDYDEDQLAQTIAAFEKDIEGGKVLEMGTNHEGAPTPLLKALALTQPSEDVTIGTFVFHKNDWVLKCELFGERMRKFLSGEMTGFSLEGVEDPKVGRIQVQESERGEKTGDSPQLLTPTLLNPAQLSLPIHGATVTVSYAR